MKVCIRRLDVRLRYQVLNADVAPLDSQEPVCQSGRAARADESKARHEFILHGFAHVLKGGPITEADVKESVLQPDEPRDTEAAKK